MIEFLQANWFWIALIVVMVAMHSFGGGCCGAGPRARRKKEPGEHPEAEQHGSCH